jgi:predicted RNase H-like nuclease
MLGMTESVFIGIDLAWRGDKNPSGGAVLRGDRQSAQLVDVNSSLGSYSAVLSYINEHATASTFVAIDAPLIVNNRKGQRRCETLIGEDYGARHASCHTSNLTLYPRPAGVDLAKQLALRGFRHASDPQDTEKQRVMFEVYPHPALLELFGLSRILKYKKGSVDARRSGQRELQQRLSELSLFDPPLECTSRLSGFLTTDTSSLRGAALKANEDALDAVLCAYIAYHYWFWGAGGIRLLGDLDSGYIVVPRLSTPSARRQALPVP